MELARLLGRTAAREALSTTENETPILKTCGGGETDTGSAAIIDFMPPAEAPGS
jgi:hypothetical protein